MFLRTREFCCRRRPGCWRRVCRLESIQDKQKVLSSFSNADSGRASAIHGRPCLDGRPIHGLVGRHGLYLFLLADLAGLGTRDSLTYLVYIFLLVTPTMISTYLHIRLFGLTLIAITVVDYTFLSFAYISFFCFLAGLGTLHLIYIIVWNKCCRECPELFR